MDLNRVSTFVQVVEQGSFTAAAARLRLPTSSVSRSVAKLEQELGLVLLERTTRKLNLTDAGRAYFERAREAVAGLGEAGELAQAAATEPSGVVRLAAPPEVAARLASLVGTFVRRYPRVHVEVTSTARGHELVGSDVDIAIVIGKLADSSLMVRRLGGSEQRLFAAAEYLQRHPAPRTVAELAAHACVLFRGIDGRATWELVGPGGLETVEVKGALGADHIQFVVEAVAAGHGIGLMPNACIAADSVDPRSLVPVLPGYVAIGAMQSLVSPSRQLPKRVALLRDYLAAELPPQCQRALQGTEPLPARPA